MNRKTLNLRSMSNDELREMNAQINAELKKRALKERQEARKKILEIANTHEIDLSTLSSTKRYYRNPENRFETWTGRGRQPKWVKEQLAKGKLLQDLEIS